MVYLPQFHTWQARDDQGQPRTARADILAPRAANGQGRFDITGLYLEVTPEIFDRLAEQMTEAGLVRKDTTDGAAFRGEDWALELRRSDRLHIEAIELSTDAVVAEPLTLGSGKLLPQADGEVRWLP